MARSFVTSYQKFDFPPAFFLDHPMVEGGFTNREFMRDPFASDKKCLRKDKDGHTEKDITPSCSTGEN